MKVARRDGGMGWRAALRPGHSDYGIIMNDDMKKS